MAISEKARLDKIPVSVARLRFNRFRENKKDAISFGINNTADEYIKYDPGAFLAICRQIINSAGNITGMKVYFACYNPSLDTDRAHIPNGKAKFVTLVFVPTVRSGNSLMYDRNDYYLMNALGYGHSSVSKGTATRWVSLFLDTVLPELPDNDTQALWYDRALIEDMITNVNIEIQSQETTQMLFCFGTYEQDERMRVKTNGQERQLFIGDQLTGTFLFGTNLIAEINTPLTTAERNAARRWIQEQSTLSDGKNRPFDTDPDSYDTGIPIPPASSGGGEGLP
jgi:hypothetical protein